jgi:hypothetical protein
MTSAQTENWLLKVQARRALQGYLPSRHGAREGIEAVHDVELGAPYFGGDAGSLECSVLLDSKKNGGGDPPSCGAMV